MAGSVQGTRVVIISPVSLLREGLARILGECPTIDVCGQGDEVSAFARLVTATKPDVVLVDINVNDLGSLSASHAQFPGTRKIALGVEENADFITRCAEAGFTGYVGRSATSAELIAALHRAASDEARCSPAIAAALMARIGQLASRSMPIRAQQTTENVPRGLTRRELQILEQLELGLTNKEIARKLNIAPATARNHVHNILDKLGAKTRGEAVAIARKPNTILDHQAKSA